ncbi:S-adenosyl-L-methionine-dependent methyltransferase [Durotheca rogersii]|uniref:S-adenosyl-L-methionine-dependent methyltransferase n=1 Tax=Durotheca rogersii TaxID=419775 RepID=UPI00222033D9|nr:S-adenosyl-L-methionine-dependent methyltransferase [Durotheca rogersii]KAI5859358.1 S-adenosyl-L-methionine-dependent methyltransferase [Durotheca rogersii]
MPLVTRHFHSHSPRLYLFFRPSSAAALRLRHLYRWPVRSENATEAVGRPLGISRCHLGATAYIVGRADSYDVDRSVLLFRTARRSAATSLSLIIRLLLPSPSYSPSFRPHRSHKDQPAMASPQSRIAELAAVVATHTQRIDSYLSEKGLPPPSFEADGPKDLGLPPDLEQSRSLVLDASQELNDLLQGPRNLLFNHEHNRLLYLKLISRFNLARKVPVDGEITFSDLAATIGIDYAALCRILRFGIAFRVFREPRPGVVAHSAASRQIAEDANLADWVGANVDEMWPSAEKVVDALSKWPLAEEPNQTGFSLANGTDKPFYLELSEDPERARRFGGAMSFFTTGPGYSLHHLTDNYSWDSLGAATVVDVGGSHGDAAFALARKYPKLHLVVQELPEVVANSKEEAGLDVKFLAHDFFEEQPVKDADVYIYRWIFHNWPDKYCIKILKALIPALKRGSRVLIMDFVMPPPCVLPNSVERKLRAMDVTMLEIGNSKERDLDEWKSLFEQADQRFAFKGVQQPPGSNLAILEAAWEG